MNASDEPRPKVLQITSIDTTIVILLWRQIREMLIAGYDVRCACTPGANGAWLQAQGVEFVGIEVNRSITPLGDLKALWKLVRYLRRERITIVHTHTPKAALLGQLAARIACVPVIINTVHGFYFHDKMKRLPWMFYVAMAWIGGRCATMTLSQNAEDINTAVRLGICKRDKIRFLGNGIDLTRFDPSRFDDAFRRQKKAELGVPDGVTVIGIIGRLVVDKGYIELFEAVKTLAAERDDFHLIIIGPEDERRAGQFGADTYKEYGIEDRVTYLGPRDDVDELMACLDVFVLPSWREGFPRSAIEAAAMGVPIVATDIRGCREVVTGGENGVLIPVRDPKAIAGALRTLLDAPDLRTRMGQAGRERAKREFDELVICERVLDLYRELFRAKGLNAPTPRSELDDTLPERGPFVW